MTEEIREETLPETGESVGKAQEQEAQDPQTDTPPETDGAEEETAADAAVARIIDGWLLEAARTEAIFPGFSLGDELGNPRFLGLLRAGADLKSAYLVSHLDEILPAAMQYAARTVEQKLVSSYLQSPPRPGENGTRGSVAAAARRDAAGLSAEDYRSICHRVSRGEKISFG